MQFADAPTAALFLNGLLACVAGRRAEDPRVPRPREPSVSAVCAGLSAGNVDLSAGYVYTWEVCRCVRARFRVRWFVCINLSLRASWLNRMNRIIRSKSSHRPTVL